MVPAASADTWTTPAAVTGCSSEGPAFDCAELIDGYTDGGYDNYWNEGGDVDEGEDGIYEWNFTVDMGESVNITGVSIYADGDQGDAPCSIGEVRVCDTFPCYASDNILTTVFNFTGTEEWQNVSVTPTTARYIYLTGGKVTGGVCANKEATDDMLYMDEVIILVGVGGGDEAPPDISLVHPTPADDEYVEHDWIYINVSASEALSSCTLGWNGTNSSMTVSGTLCYLNKTGLLNATSYEFSIFANDTAGNANSTAARTATINLTAPTVYLELIGAVREATTRVAVEHGGVLFVGTGQVVKFIDTSLMPTWTPSSPVLGQVTCYGEILDIFINDTGNRMYVASEGNLTIWDISDTSDPSLVSSYNNTVYTFSDVEVNGSYIYAVAGDTDLVVLNISDETAPEVAGTYNHGGGRASYRMDLYNSHVYLSNNHKASTGGAGIIIVDVSDPANPAYVSNFTTQERATDVEVFSNDMMTVAEIYRGMYTVNITDKANPTELGWYGNHTYGGNGAIPAFELHQYGGLAYLSVEYKGPYTFNVTDPANIWLVNETSVTTDGAGHSDKGIDAGYSRYVYAMDGYVFTSLESMGVDVYDNSDPSDLTFVNRIHTVGDIVGITVVDQYIYLAVRNDGLWVFDCTNPANCSYANFTYTSERYYDCIYDGNNTLFCSGSLGMNIIDITDRTGPTVINTSWDDSHGGWNSPLPTDMLINSHILFADMSGFSAVNITDRDNPVKLNETDMRMYGIGNISDTVFVVADRDISYGAYVVDVSDPSYPLLLSNDTTYDHYQSPVAISDDGNHAFIGTYTTNCIVSFDVSNTSAISIADDSLCFPGDWSPSDFKMYNGFLFATGTDEIKVINVTDPTSLSVIATEASITSGSGNAFLNGSLLYTVTYSEGFYVYNLNLSIDYNASGGGGEEPPVIDTTPPGIAIETPLNSTYRTSVFPLTVSAYGDDVDSIIYDLDGYNYTMGAVPSPYMTWLDDRFDGDLIPDGWELTRWSNWDGYWDHVTYDLDYVPGRWTIVWNSYSDTSHPVLKGTHIGLTSVFNVPAGTVWLNTSIYVKSVQEARNTTITINGTSVFSTIGSENAFHNLGFNVSQYAGGSINLTYDIIQTGTSITSHSGLDQFHLLNVTFDGLNPPENKTLYLGGNESAHSLSVWINDTSGNMNSTAHGFYFDTLPPEILSPATLTPCQTAGTPVTSNWHQQDNLDDLTVWCDVGGTNGTVTSQRANATAGCSGTTPADGTTFDLTIHVCDYAGNCDSYGYGLNSQVKCGGSSGGGGGGGGGYVPPIPTPNITERLPNCTLPGYTWDPETGRCRPPTAPGDVTPAIAVEIWFLTPSVVPFSFSYMAPTDPSAVVRYTGYLFSPAQVVVMLALAAWAAIRWRREKRLTRPTLLILALDVAFIAACVIYAVPFEAWQSFYLDPSQAFLPPGQLQPDPAEAFPSNADEAWQRTMDIFKFNWSEVTPRFLKP